MFQAGDEGFSPWPGVASTAAAFALSGLIFHFSGSPPTIDGFFYPEGFVGAVVNGIATGLLVGGAQWLILRTVHLGSWRWLVGTALALWFAHVIADVISDRYAMALLALGGGLLLGALQWWARRWTSRTGAIWTAASTIAWAAGIWIGNLLGGTAEDWRVAHLILASAVGILLGITTGVLWMLNAVMEKRPAKSLAT